MANPANLNAAIDPLDYTGARINLAPLVIYTFDPQSNNLNYTVGTFWLNRINSNLWYLPNKTTTVANWTLISNSGGAITDIQTDTGLVTPVNGLINLLGGTGCQVDGSGDTATVNVTGGGLTWNSVTGTSQSAAVDNGYYCSNVALVTVTLPTTAAAGTVIGVMNLGAGNTKVAYGTGQSLRIGNTTTTVTTGSITSTAQGDCVLLLCTTANTTWTAISVQGNWTPA
jgi:hypothetical protein